MFTLGKHSIEEACVVIHIGLVRVGLLLAIRGPLLVTPRAGRRRRRLCFFFFFLAFLHYLDAPPRRLRPRGGPSRQRSCRLRFFFFFFLKVVRRSGAQWPLAASEARCRFAARQGRLALPGLFVLRALRTPSPARRDRRRLLQRLRPFLWRSRGGRSRDASLWCFSFSPCGDVCDLDGHLLCLNIVIIFSNSRRLVSTIQ